jgi:enoyl-CoA hydratase/carnithine racemase
VVDACPDSQAARRGVPSAPTGATTPARNDTQESELDVTPLKTEYLPSRLVVITIDSPPVNLYDESMHASLQAAIEQVTASEAGAVLFQAIGRVFTGGVDLGFLERLGGPRAARRLFCEMIDIVHQVEELPVPTMLAAHATCLTWAFELALGCDLIVAAESAQFGMVEKRFALIPAMGGTQRLAARAGLGRAREMVMTGGLYSAADLATWNVVNKVLPDEGFAQAARAIAEDLAGGPRASHAANKAVLREYVATGVSGADGRMPTLAAPLHSSEEHQMLVQNFLAKKKTQP